MLEFFPNIFWICKVRRYSFKKIELSNVEFLLNDITLKVYSQKHLFSVGLKNKRLKFLSSWLTFKGQLFVKLESFWYQSTKKTA